MFGTAPELSTGPRTSGVGGDGVCIVSGPEVGESTADLRFSAKDANPQIKYVIGHGLAGVYAVTL